MSMLINDRKRCGRCKYWKAMRCTNKASKLYGFEMFQHENGICDLWEMPDEIPDDDDGRKEGE